MSGVGQLGTVGEHCVKREVLVEVLEVLGLVFTFDFVTGSSKLVRVEAEVAEEIMADESIDSDGTGFEL